MKTCIICKEEKSRSGFGKNKTKEDGLQTYCISCQKVKDRKYYQKNRTSVRARRNSVRKILRQYAYDYLLEHSCVDCDEEDPVVLDFDHVRGKKRGSISRLITHDSLNTLKKEIAKCDVRCSNCHRRKTAKQFGWYESLAPVV